MRRKPEPLSNDELANRLTGMAMFFRTDKRHVAARTCLAAADRLRAQAGEVVPKVSPKPSDPH